MIGRCWVKWALRLGWTLGLLGGGVGQAVADEPAAKTRFLPVHVWVDTVRPLSAYQLTLLVAEGAAKLVGVENGAHPSFGEAPLYDPAALKGNGRVVLAALADAAPAAGRHRLVTAHMQVRGGPPRFAVRGVVLVAADGKKMKGRLWLETPSGPDVSPKD